MAQKKLGEYATPNADYIRVAITQPAEPCSAEPIWGLNF
jgi:hypothetical protein